jgi:hypothetical protein
MARIGICKIMKWFITSVYPAKKTTIDKFPFFVGRNENHSLDGMVFQDMTVSRDQFVLESRVRGLVYKNLSKNSPAELDGKVVYGECKLGVGTPHVVNMGNVIVVIGSDSNMVNQMVMHIASERYIVNHDAADFGLLKEDDLLNYCENGIFKPTTKVCCVANPDKVMEMSELIDFGYEGVEPVESAPVGEKKRMVVAEEVQAELGESFMCPYCRTVSDLADVLSVSTSPALLGDPVLGEGEQRRFLPSQFTGNGLALDSEGGVCTEIACPRCHMALPRMLLDTPQMVMSVIGAAGAGKSVFLASSMWQCRQVLGRMFGVSFMDLDPVSNRWINAYEEKLFFQEDDQSLQQIEKTDLQASNVCRTVMMDGDSVLLPLPSFFQIRTKAEPQPQSLVVYDSAGEHFRAGADTQASAVTLNMLNADVLFFMFDPSADPRFRPMLDHGTGTAHNYAQRQDVLLAEMAARIRRHMGNRCESRLTKPLIFGVSKADLLRQHLPLDAEIYKKIDDKRYALDLNALRCVSEATEALLNDITPEVTATAHDIASEVWFVPVSALGHNPMREGVRPCDIKPLWTELPVVFTLAKKGLVPNLG